MPSFDWNEPLDAPEGSCFFWTETKVQAFGEDLDLTVYFESRSEEVLPPREPELDPRLTRLSEFVERAHEHLRQVLREHPEALGVSAEEAAIALANPEPGAFADATEITVYADGDTLVRFPYTDLPGTDEFGVGVAIKPGGTLELHDLRESVELGEGSAS